MAERPFNWLKVVGENSQVFMNNELLCRGPSCNPCVTQRIAPGSTTVPNGKKTPTGWIVKLEGTDLSECRCGRQQACLLFIETQKYSGEASPY